MADWNRFWFQPADDRPLAVIRIATGLLLTYSQMVWTLNSASFFGSQSWLNRAAVEAVRTSRWVESPLWLVEHSPVLTGLLLAAGLLAGLALTAGVFARVAAPLAFLTTVTLANRNPAALYGFDQVLSLLTLYLCIHPGHRSLLLFGDWSEAASRSSSQRAEPQPSVTANIALRLIQCHLCLIYLVAGLSKLQGASWWSGVAVWGAIASPDYQTLDLTWLVRWPVVINGLTHITLAWEISYAFLIWNRRLRPLLLALAGLVHLGIGLSFGLLPFGLVMMAANLAFAGSWIATRKSAERAVG